MAEIISRSVLLSLKNNVANLHYFHFIRGHKVGLICAYVIFIAFIFETLLLPLIFYDIIGTEDPVSLIDNKKGH